MAYIIGPCGFKVGCHHLGFLGFVAWHNLDVLVSNKVQKIRVSLFLVWVFHFPNFLGRCVILLAIPETSRGLVAKGLGKPVLHPRLTGARRRRHRPAFAQGERLFSIGF
jgi:hypothetical protein